MAFLNKPVAEWTHKEWNEYWLFVSGVWFADKIFGALLQGGLKGIIGERPAE